MNTIVNNTKKNVFVKTLIAAVAALLIFAATAITFNNVSTASAAQAYLDRCASTLSNCNCAHDKATCVPWCVVCTDRCKECDDIHMKMRESMDGEAKDAAQHAGSAL